MKVILRKDYEHLGQSGQVVEVKKGYASNFLIPNGIAVIATDSNKRHSEEVTRQQSRKRNKELEEAKKLAGDLSNVSVDITVKTGEENRLFGSVTSQMVHDALVEKGYSTLDKRKISIGEPIKTLGEHEVDIKLHHTVVAKIKVNVKKEGGEDVAEETTEVAEQTNEASEKETPASVQE
jgi:large subunit ribosomal protein L9